MEQRRARLTDLAFRDRLTELPNRLGFERELEAAVSAAAAAGQPLAILRVRLERLPEIENTVGDDAARAVVSEIAQRLAAHASGGTLARLGDAEFALLLPGADAESATATARSIGRTLEEPPRALGLPILVEPTIGISVQPEHGSAGAALLRAAGVAASAARKLGTTWATYGADRDPYDPRSIELLAALGEALDGGEQLQLHYQPAVDLRTRRVVGVEALLRWKSPRFGPVPPDQFIPLAERTGLVRPLSRWVLTEAFHQARDWRADGVELSVGVNLSARNLYESDVVERIRGLRETWGVPWRGIELEITESALIDDPHRARDVLERLHGLGITLAIDDFGTGYSSLTHLRDLPFSKLKIDKSFVLGVTTSEEDAAFVRAIVDLGHALDMQVQAEGIETAEALDLLTKLGCDLAQGYHIGRPMPEKDLRGWLRESPWADPDDDAEPITLFPPGKRS
jgi:diguanylate cyclase (GGDEF)-like protein